VYVQLPDIRGREQILNIHMRKLPIGQDVNPSVIARGTPGMSGADLANLCNEAALMAARRNARVVEMQDFEKAKDKIFMGPERKSMVMTDDEKRATAYHESGHAVVAEILPGTDPVHKVTVMPRGRALGVTWQLPERDKLSHYVDQMQNEISILFGGRIAEDLFVKRISTGASNDYERATKIARDMVTRYGMSDLMGPMVYAENEGEVFLGRSVTKTTNISEHTQQMVDAETRRILDEQYAVAQRILETHGEKVQAMTDALMKWETIGREQIEDIMAGKEPRAPKDWTPRASSSDGSSGSGGTPAVKPDPSPTAA
jgi:cell division protease FtsH